MKTWCYAALLLLSAGPVWAQNADGPRANCRAFRDKTESLEALFSSTYGNADLGEFEKESVESLMYLNCAHVLDWVNCRDLDTLVFDDQENHRLDRELFATRESDPALPAISQKSREFHRVYSTDVELFGKKILETIHSELRMKPASEYSTQESISTPFREGQFTVHVSIHSWRTVHGGLLQLFKEQQVDDLTVEFTANSGGLQVCVTAGDETFECLHADSQAKKLHYTSSLKNCTGRSE